MELAPLQNPRAPLAGLARQQISLLRQASEVLQLPLSPLGLLDLVRLPWLVPLTLALGGLVGQQAVAGEMQVRHNQLGLQVCDLSTRRMCRF